MIRRANSLSLAEPSPFFLGTEKRIALFAAPKTNVFAEKGKAMEYPKGWLDKHV